MPVGGGRSTLVSSIFRVGKKKEEKVSDVSPAYPGHVEDDPILPDFERGNSSPSRMIKPPLGVPHLDLDRSDNRVAEDAPLFDSIRDSLQALQGIDSADIDKLLQAMQASERDACGTFCKVVMREMPNALGPAENRGYNNGNRHLVDEEAIVEERTGRIATKVLQVLERDLVPKLLDSIRSELASVKVAVNEIRLFSESLFEGQTAVLKDVIADVECRISKSIKESRVSKVVVDDTQVSKGAIEDVQTSNKLKEDPHVSIGSERARPRYASGLKKLSEEDEHHEEHEGAEVWMDSAGSTCKAFEDSTDGEQKRMRERSRSLAHVPGESGSPGGATPGKRRPSSFTRTSSHGGARKSVITDLGFDAMTSESRKKTTTIIANNFPFEHYEGVDPCEHYDIKEVLGQGSFGTVRLGTHKQLGSERAIKSLFTMGAAGQKIKDEIELMRGLDHPNILRLFATYEVEKNIHLVMEVCGGGELFDALLATKCGFSERTVAGAMKQILMAVGYLHRQMICHRDLKPENFLLSKKGNVDEARIKLIDFGTAKSFANGELMTTKVCTVFYVAPEILSTKLVPYNELCDIWSLGVVMYLLLCGQPPFQGETDRDTMKLVKKGRYQLQPEELWCRVSDDAKDLLSSMLEVAPSKRANSQVTMRHRWITEMAPDASDQLLMDSNVLLRLKHFVSQNRLQKLALQLVAQNLRDDQINDIREAFVAIDVDNSGSLQVEEIEEVILKSNLEGKAAEDIKAVLHEMQAEGGGSINYTQFLGATIDRSKCVDTEAVRIAFRTFDVDGDGFISRDELEMVLSLHGGGAQENGEEPTQEGMSAALSREVAVILSDADRNGDGEISFNEFAQMMGLSVDEIDSNEAEWV